MSERRRAEIAEKRARLAALRAAREQREAAAARTAASSPSADSYASGQAASLTDTALDRSTTTSRASLGASAAAASSRGDEIENLLRGVGVVGRERERATPSSPSSPGGTAERSATPVRVAAEAQDGSASPRAKESEATEAAGRRSVGTSSDRPETAPEEEVTLRGESNDFVPPPVASTSTPTQTSPALPATPPPPKPRIVYDKAIQTSAELDPASSFTAAAIGGTPSSSSRTATTSGTSTSGLGVGVEGVAATGGAGRETAEELRARIVAELEAERQRLDAEIALEKRIAEEQLEAERARGLSGEQLSSVLASPGFVEFLEQSTKVVQRALSDPYDYLRDYSINTDEDAAAAEGKKARVRLLGAWQDQQWGRGRSVTSVDWSPKFPELFVAAYNKKPLSINEPDGIAAVWNLHLQDRPEYVFHAQSDILSIAFSPFNSNLVVGGTYSGQILLWDTRSRHSNAVLKTPLSTSGHTHPVYSLALLGTQNANSLVSASTDGVVCAWSLDMLARPQETLELVHPAHSKTDEVSITSLGFPLGETATFWCSTEEGNVYAAHRYDRAGAKAGLIHNEVYRGHSGPVTGLDFHPAEGSVDLSDLFLTSGVDWTVRLWRAGGANPARTAGGGAGVTGTALSQNGGASQHTSSAGGGRSSLSSSRLGSSTSGPPPPGTVPPLFTFEEAGDHVYDVRWHPLHPAVFGTVDAAGKFNLWNLNVDTEVPIVSTAVGDTARPRGLNKLAWERTEGRRAAVGSSDGKVYVYEISPDLVTPREGDWDQMRRTCNAALAEQLSPDGYR